MADEEKAVDDRNLERVRIIEGLVRAGQIDTGTVKHIRQFRVSTLQELVCLRVLTENESGLRQRKNEFIENPWGFPFVPVPKYNQYNAESRRLHLAPNHVSFEWLGHPMYWLDPNITRFRRTEMTDPARWAVRMYYTMLAAGLLRKDNGTVRWVNAIRARGIQYSRETWEQYAKGYDTPEIDSVVWGIEDIERNGMTIQDVEEATTAALKAISEIQSKSVTKFRTVRDRAFRDGVTLVSSANDQNNRLTKAVGEAASLTKSISSAIFNRHPVADKVDDLFRNANEVIDLISEMDNDAMILSAPIIRETVASRLQYATIATSLHNYEVRRRSNRNEHEVMLAAQRLVGLSDKTDEQEFLIYQKVVQAQVTQSWRKLKLAVTNHIRAAQGQTPLSSPWEMDAVNDMGAETARLGN